MKFAPWLVALMEGRQRHRADDARREPLGTELPLVGLVQIGGAAREQPIELGRAERPELSQRDRVLAVQLERVGRPLLVAQRLETEVGSRIALVVAVAGRRRIPWVVAGVEVGLAARVLGERRLVLGRARVEIGGGDTVVLRLDAERHHRAPLHRLRALRDVEEVGAEVAVLHRALEGLGRGSSARPATRPRASRRCRLRR